MQNSPILTNECCQMEGTPQYQQLTPQDPIKGNSSQEYLESNRQGTNRYANVLAVVEKDLQI